MTGGPVCAILCAHLSLRAKNDAEKVQGFVGKRDSGDRDCRGRRRRPDLRRVRGRAQGGVSVDGTDVRRNARSEEHTSEFQSHSDLVCRLLLEKKKKKSKNDKRQKQLL